MQPIVVGITDAMLRSASEYERAVQETATLRTTPNYTGLVAPGRYRVGHLGECVLAALLDQRSLRYHWAPRADGVSDTRDLMLYRDGVGHPCEIKTASQPHHRYLMQPVAQDRRRGDRGVMIGVRLNEPARVAHVIGYVSHARFRDARVVLPPEQGVLVPTRMTLLSSLTPIDRLLARVDRVYRESDGVFGDGATEDPGPGPD